MKLLKKYFFLLLIIFISHANNNLLAQIYPVQISAQLVPPYSGYLPDYADPTAEKLKVILQFNDFSQAQYNIKLRFEIKGNGFTISTKTFYNPPAITLLPGQPLLLSGADLAPYLNTNNLDFVGINQSQYQQRMALPEGYYNICVKAYDYYNTNPIQISNEACAQAWFTLSDPPYLNMPFCGTAITPLTPQNILFQWTPVNMASPNSALNTEYEFALYECRPDSNANPNQVVLSTAPIFSTTTQQTFLNYGIAEPPLNLYMKYVWRVRAKDITGRDLFKNNGYSQICTFTNGTIKNIFGNTLGLSLTARAINHRNGECTFTKQSVYSNYMLQVRKQNTTYWFNFPNTTGLERIPNLEPNTVYECRVRGEAGTLIGDWSNTEIFKTLLPPVYSCNDNTQPVNVSQQPLPPSKAVVGLVIQSGQFEVVTTQIQTTGQPGWYKGKGYALVFGGLPVAVEWKNIYIDSEQRQQQGIIEAMTKGIDKWLNDWDIKEAEENATYTEGEIDSVYVNGNQICYTLQGSSAPLCIPTPTGVNVVVIRDEEGDQWNVQLMPPPPKVTGPANYLNISDDQLEASDNLKVVFEAYADQKFGFDKKEYAAFIDNYEVIKLANGKSYFVPNKSVGESDNDVVLASYTITGNNNPQVTFKTKSGTSINATSEGGKFKLTGIPANAECVYAYFENKKIGKLNVVSLKAIAKKLVIVSVNGANTNLTASQLNGIYKQANVTWSVATASNFTFNLGSDGLEAAEATLLSKYSPEMRALRDAYKQTHSDYDKDAYYVFVVPNFKDANLRGYMVRGRALGFVIDKAKPKEVAHELAHGAFGLEHTFPEAKLESTNNLLDYTVGISLVKEQWEEIQNPGIILSWNDEEEDASISSMVNCNVNNLPDEMKRYYPITSQYTSELIEEFSGYVALKGSASKLFTNSFCAYTRIKLIQGLLKTPVTEADENAILVLIESTPESDVNSLKIWLELNNYELYLQLINDFNDAGIGQNSYTKLTEALCLTLGKNGNSTSIDKIFKQGLIYEYNGNTNRLKAIPLLDNQDVIETNTWNKTVTYNEHRFEIDPKSELNFDIVDHFNKRTYSVGSVFIQPNCSTCVYASQSISGSLKPFDLVALIPKSAQTFNDFTLPTGEIRLVPALYFRWLQKKNFNQNIQNVGYAVAGVISMATGVGEIIQAANWMKTVMPACEIYFGASAVINSSNSNAFDNFLSQGLTPDQLTAYRTAELCVNIFAVFKTGRATFKNVKPKVIGATQDLYNKLNNSPQFFKNLKTQFPDKYNQLKEYFQKVLGKNIDELVSDVFKVNPKNIREESLKWPSVKKSKFEKADQFYSNSGYTNYDNHLRGIDFDKSVDLIEKTADQYLYQYCYIDKKTGLPKVGSYFYESSDIDVTKLGFGIDGRVKIRVKLSSNSTFLRSVAADIEDWVPGSNKMFHGGEIQLFNPNAIYTEVKIID